MGGLFCALRQRTKLEHTHQNAEGHQGLQSKVARRLNTMRTAKTADGAATLRAKTKPVKQKKHAVPNLPAHLQPALIRLVEMYDQARSLPHDDAVAALFGIRDLIAHHPKLRAYHRALDQIVKADQLLSALSDQVRAL